MNLDPAIVFVARLAVGALFLTASVQKLRQFAEFRGVILAYGLPEWSLWTAAVFVVALEVVAGVGSLAGASVGLIVAGALLTGYAGAMAINLLRGHRLLDCGCSTKRQPVSWSLVVRNLCIVPLVLLGLAEPASRSLGALDYACIVGGVSMLALLYGAANEILAARLRLEEWV